MDCQAGCFFFLYELILLCSCTNPFFQTFLDRPYNLKQPFEKKDDMTSPHKSFTHKNVNKSACFFS